MNAFKGLLTTLVISIFFAIIAVVLYRDYMYIINSHNETVAEENKVVGAEIEVNIEEVEPQDIVVESFEFGYQFDLETDYFTSNVYCSEENNYYLDHDSEGRENPYGEVYFNKNEYDNGFFILYGHNMNDGSMFGKLHNLVINDDVKIGNIVYKVVDEMVIDSSDFYREIVEKKADLYLSTCDASLGKTDGHCIARFVVFLERTSE